MRELLLLLLFAPVGLMVLLNQEFATFQAPQAPLSTPVVVATIGNPVPAVSPTPTGSNLGDILDVARTWLGVPYLWGGCTRQGVDCSCFVMNVLGAIGIRAPRTTVQQIAWAMPISAAQARLGDLVFFDNTCLLCGANPTHVGLVIGAGMMIDAGDPVKIEPIFTRNNARYGRPYP